MLEGRAELELGGPGREATPLGGRRPGRRSGSAREPSIASRALEDTLMLEVSTPHLDDVVRLEDAYGRAEPDA